VKPLLAAITLVSLIIFTIAATAPSRRPSPPFESCSCQADDGSCQTSGTCPRGCLAYCPSNNCRVTCVNNGLENEIDTSVTLSLQLTEADSSKVGAELHRLTGAPVVFKPRRPDATITRDFKNETLWNVLESLVGEGSVQIANEDFGHLRSMRHSLVSGERMAVCFSNVTAKRLARDLTFLSGREVYVTAGDPKTVINYKGKAVTLDEMVAAISFDASIQISIR
jgi:hypothetical protein